MNHASGGAVDYFSYSVHISGRSEENPPVLHLEF